MTRDNAVTWTGPNGITARGSNVLAAVPSIPGRYRYIGTTNVAGCTFRDSVEVRVVPGSAWQARQNTNLALAANWTCLPTPTTDAELRGVSGGQPILSTGLVQVRNLTVRAGTTLTLDGGTLEIYGTLTLEAGATLGGANGTLSLRGAAVSLTAPTGTALNVPRLLVNLPAAADTARLGQNVTVGTTLMMQRGILKTQAASLNLAQGATISETPVAYVSGRVLASGQVAVAGGSESFGGVGLSLTQATGPVGALSLARITDQAIGQAPARTSIRRYYVLTYPANVVVNATVRLGYRDAELNGLAEADLQPFRSNMLTIPATGPWLPVARTTQDASFNYVESASTIAGTWTLSTGSAMLPTRHAAATTYTVQAQPVPFGAAGFSLALQATRAQRANSVAVYDLTGRLLMQRTVAVPAGLSAVALPEAGGLPAGVYVVRVVLDGEAQTLRVTRE